MRGEHVQSLPQGIILFLVVGDDNRMDNPVRRNVSVGKKLGVQVTSLTARCGAELAGRRKGFGAGERGARFGDALGVALFRHFLQRL